MFTPSTVWVEANSAIVDSKVLPEAVCSHIPATIRRADTDGRAEWIADLGDGFTTMLRGDHTPGETTLHGCLLWDRYLWIDYRTEPTGQVRLVDRAGHIVQREHLTPSKHPGWSDIHHSGPLLYSTTRNIPADHDTRFNTLLVDTRVTA